MSSRKISWEIVLAGIAFLTIGIYLLGQYSPDGSEGNMNVNLSSPAAPEAPQLPGALVIDLGNLENLSQLKELKNLENLEELKNLGELIKQNISKEEQGKVKSSLEDLEAKLQKIGEADFNVKLQDRKVYINRKYDVSEAKWGEVDPGVYVFHESFPTQNISSLLLKADFGNINIVGGDVEQGEITLRATGDVNEQSFFSNNFKVIKNLESENAEFQIQSAEGSNVSDLINLEATVTIPANKAIDIRTSGGHITAQNLEKNQKFNTSGGHITLDNISGETTAETGGGHISGTQLSGSTTLVTGGGHIRVSNSSGSLNAKTGGGHIQISDARGTITGKTSGGNISASVQETDGPLTFSTSAGNVSLAIPETLQADLDITGASINIADAFDFDGSKTNGKIDGTINGGGIPIVINCGYGSVNIDPIN